MLGMSSCDCSALVKAFVLDVQQYKNLSGVFMVGLAKKLLLLACRHHI
jgi:hypothetical protein